MMNDILDAATIEIQKKLIVITGTEDVRSGTIWNNRNSNPSTTGSHGNNGSKHDKTKLARLLQYIRCYR